MAKNPLSAVTSLGGYCQTSYQLRRYFNWPIPSPLDWLVTPVSKLSLLFDERAARFAESTQNIMIEEAGREYVTCDSYGTTFPHYFDYTADGTLIAPPEALDRLRDKLKRKYAEMEDGVNLFDEVLFVRLGTYCSPPVAWPYMCDPEPMPHSQINQLQASIAGAFPDTRCKLLQVIYDDISQVREDEPLSEDCLVRTIKITPDLDWQGSDRTWNQLLAEFSGYGPVRVAPEVG